jgi:uncharacterized DUF497 family protein
VRFAWNPDKRASNLDKHAIDFSAVEAFEWATALVEADTREHYGEVRLIALGLLGARVHVVVFTIRRGSIWVISLRKASKRETTRYAAQG